MPRTFTRLGFQIPNFNFPGVRDTELFERVARMAAAAEDAGFDTVFVMDHFYQLPMLGPADWNMLEAYTLLGALAARTRRARLGTLVTGNTYRNPALLAKIVTTLDVISGGRALLGVGTGWFEEEHVGLGFRFGTLRERFDRFEEALAILRPMLRDERPTFQGRFYSTKAAINRPRPLQDGGPPLMIGGAGEKRTLRLAAEHADESNLPCPLEEVPRKLEALARHCEAVGRDRRSIGVSVLFSLVVGRTTAEAEAARDRLLAQRGMVWSTLPEAMRAAISKVLVVGDPDTVGELVRRKVAEPGLDGLVVNLPANGHELEAIALAGEVLAKAL
ncbi:MAG TPA: LLM class F420-dependent oxidoreductase [Myxococcota bacterium]|jgi:F420-dependent oxidoreductase-like protein|nr:LLM class F420-dependent oxidoreductase [Myxococcota bacterium]